MKPKRGRILTAATLLCVAGCDHGGGGTPFADPDSGGRAGWIDVRTPDGASEWTTRIDGQVLQVHSAELFPGGRQTVVVTGDGPGSDQSSMLVFDGAGALRWRYRVSGETPAGHRLLHPSVAGLVAHVHGDRRFVATQTGGQRGPYSLEVIELDETRGLVPRYRFWNPGVISPPAVGDGLIAIRCLCNSHRPPNDERTYPLAICVLSLRDALKSVGDAAPREGRAPWRDSDRRDHSGHGYVRCFLLPQAEVFGGHQEFAVTIVDGRVRAQSETGILYVLDPSTGAVDVEADDALRSTHATGGTPESGRPDLDEMLARLRAGVVTVAPDPQ